MAVFLARMVMPRSRLQFVRIHHPFGQGFVGAEGAGLAQHSIHECRLAMVDVGDDGDITNGRAHGRRISYSSGSRKDVALID